MSVTDTRDTPTGPARLTRTDVMTAAEAATLLSCSTRHIYDLARRGALPGARRLGRTTIVVRPILEAWLLSGRPDST